MSTVKRVLWRLSPGKKDLKDGKVLPTHNYCLRRSLDGELRLSGERNERRTRAWRQHQHTFKAWRSGREWISERLHLGTNDKYSNATMIFWDERKSLCRGAQDTQFKTEFNFIGTQFHCLTWVSRILSGSHCCLHPAGRKAWNNTHGSHSQSTGKNQSLGFP